MAFKFKINDVVIDQDQQQGVIIGRFEFAKTSPGYLVGYFNKDGSTRDQYKSESELTKKEKAV